MMPRGAVDSFLAGKAKLSRAGHDPEEFIGSVLAGGRPHDLELQLEEPLRSVAVATANAAELLASVYGPKWVIEQAKA